MAETLFQCIVTGRFTYGYSRGSPPGSTERPNVLESEGSNQWLTLLVVSEPQSAALRFRNLRHVPGAVPTPTTTA